MGSYHKLDTLIAEIEIHKALNTPHKWVNIPNVSMPGPRGEARTYDVRICELCYHGEKLVGRGDKIWTSLEGHDTMGILNRYKAFLKKEAL